MVVTHGLGEERLGRVCLRDQIFRLVWTLGDADTTLEVDTATGKGSLETLRC